MQREEICLDLSWLKAAVITTGMVDVISLEEEMTESEKDG